MRAKLAEVVSCSSFPYETKTMVASAPSRTMIPVSFASCASAFTSTTTGSVRLVPFGISITCASGATDSIHFCASFPKPQVMRSNRGGRRA